MSRPARNVLWIGVLFLLLLLLILILRSREAGQRTARGNTGPIEPRAIHEEPSLPEISPDPPAEVKESTAAGPIPAPATSPPASALVNVSVSDVYGIGIKSPGLSILIESGKLSFETTEDQLMKFRVFFGEQARVRIICGDLNSPHSLSPGDNPIRLSHGNEFGELAVKPAEWERVQIRPKGTPDWRNPTGSDPEIGRRFLFVNPGEYEISDHKGFVAGTAVVAAGQRTTFVLTRLGAIKLDVSFTNESEEKKAPKSLPVEIRGITANASFPNGYRIFLMTRNNQRSFVESGLQPGTYQVTSEALSPRYQETFVIQGGDVRIAKFIHAID